MKTTQKIGITAVAIVAATFLAWKAQPDSAAARATLVQDQHGRMVTDVVIDGQGPFPFIVDTGAPMSCISQQLAERLHLPTLPLVRVQVQGTAGQEQSSMYIARSYSSPLFERHLERLVGLAHSPAVTNGVLGMNAFANRQVVFDFANHSMYVRESQAAQGEVIRGRLQGTDLSVDIEVDGVRATAFIDTGARRTIANAALMRALSIKTEGLPKTDSIEGATKDKLPARSARVTYLRVGSVRFAQPPLVVADLLVFERRGLRDTPAVVLGIDLLSKFNVMSVDYSRSELGIQF
ncbi:MAG: retroviral-like aspartic protease family protein [Terriglobales bacterium]